jgi:hypothetical protein
MRPLIGVILGWLLAGPLCGPAGADGGSLHLSAKHGGYQIAVFTAPTPFRAGAVDISVLVQDASSGNPMTDVKVIVRMTKSGRPALESSATSEAATNKLFRAAQFELPEPGRWEMQIEVEGPHGLAVIRSDVVAAEPLPRWRMMWPWFGWPALAIAFFGIHQILARRTTGKPTAVGTKE